MTHWRRISPSTEVEGPKVLIFHTHISEAFADSDMSKGKEEGIWGAEISEGQKSTASKFLHHDGVYNRSMAKETTGAYERLEPGIRKILEENPSYRSASTCTGMVSPKEIHLVTEVNGKPTAKMVASMGCAV